MSDYGDLLLDYITAAGGGCYLTLDAVTGGADQSAYDHDGTAQGGLTIGGHTATYPPILGAPQSCTDFTAVHYLTTTYACFAQGSVRTFLGWAYRDTNTDGDAIMGGTGADLAPSLRLVAATYDARWRADQSAGEFDDWVGSFPLAQWVFWVLVFDDPNDAAHLYIDGEFVSTQTHTITYNAGAGNLLVGDERAGYTPWDGKMGHIGVVEGALSADQIADLYSYAINGAPGPGPAYPVTDEPFPSASGFYPASGGEVAPTVTTGAESDVSYFTATLNGTVDPNGLTTHYWFEYGLTVAYGSQTPEWSIGAGTDPVLVDDSLLGLVDNTTYHYRLVAQNGAGTSYGADGTLTTLDALVPVVVTGAATNLTSTSAILNGTVDPEGQVTYARFQYGLTVSYGSQTHVQDVGSGIVPVAISASITINPFAIYHYRLIGWSLAGWTYGEDRTFSGLYGPSDLTLIHEGGKGQ